MFISFVVLFVFLGGVSLFLGKELLKKFFIFKNFSESSPLMIHWDYSTSVSGMRNIVLQGDAPFCILVGFELRIPLLNHVGFDYYGFVCSDKNNKAVVSTYLIKGKKINFRFMKNQDIPLSISSNETDQRLVPHVIFPPHWWQRFGL